MHYIQQIFKDLKIKNTFIHLRHEYESNPNHDTLLGIKQLLEHYHVKVDIYKNEDMNFENIEYPIVCSLKDGIRALTQKPEDPSALKDWNGIFLYCDVSHAREPHYLMNKIGIVFQYGLPWMALVALLVLLTFALWPLPGSTFSPLPLLLTLLNATGFYFSYRTVANECGESCSKVTESAGGKLFGLYSLGTVGMCYFTGLLVTLFVPAFASLIPWTVAIAALLPIWSISYQAFVVHSWCKNCLAVQAVLLLSLLCMLSFGTFVTPEWLYIPAYIALYVVLFFTFQIYYTLKKKGVVKDVTLTFQTMLKNPEIMKKMMETLPSVDTRNASNLLFGESEKGEVIFYVSPFCAHCHELITKLHQINSKGILQGYGIRIVLSTGNKYERMIAGDIINEYLTNGRDAGFKRLYEWFTRNTLRKRSKKERYYVNEALVEKELAMQEAWSKKAQFSSTPITILNGKILTAGLDALDILKV